MPAQAASPEPNLARVAQWKAVNSTVSQSQSMANSRRTCTLEQALHCAKCGAMAPHVEECTDPAYSPGETVLIECPTRSCRVKPWFYCKSCKKRCHRSSMQRHAKSPGHLRNTTIDLSAVACPEAQTAQRSSPEDASPANLSRHPSPHTDQPCPEFDSTFLCSDLDPPSQSALLQERSTNRTWNPLPWTQKTFTNEWKMILQSLAHPTPKRQGPLLPTPLLPTPNQTPPNVISPRAESVGTSGCATFFPTRGVPPHKRSSLLLPTRSS